MYPLAIGGDSPIQNAELLEPASMSGIVCDDPRHSCNRSCYQMDRNFFLYVLAFAYAEVVKFDVICFKAGQAGVTCRQECYRQRYAEVSQKVSNGVLETLLGSVASATRSAVAVGSGKRAREIDSEAGGASRMASECTTSLSSRSDWVARS